MGDKRAFVSIEALTFACLATCVWVLFWSRYTDQTMSSSDLMPYHMDPYGMYLHTTGNQTVAQSRNQSASSRGIHGFRENEYETGRTIQRSFVQKNVVTKFPPVTHLDGITINISTPENEMSLPGTTNESLDTTTNTVCSKPVKSILLWNAHFGSVDYGFGLGDDAFRSHGCIVHQCSMTTNRSLVNVADAVVFHAFHTYRDEMPPRSNLEQIWVFYNMENPLKTEVQLRGTNDRYNLTYTYLEDPDTDIAVGIRRLKFSNNYMVPNSKFPEKTKMVAWAVSNCHAQGARMEYVQELGKYAQVDIYGECGNLSCPKTEKHDCFSMFAKTYYFFLAFENSFCKGYITEKTYRTLRFDIVPIVMGGGAYSDVLPEKSLIDVRDFNSPKALAQYLGYLVSNGTAYLEYFQWKTKPSFNPGQSLLRSKRAGFCQLCSILHNKTYPFKYNFDVENYWSPDRLCLRGTDELKAVHLVH